MQTYELSLPTYPVECDVWDVLSREGRPIVVYGMGNGADKLFSKFEELNIKVADVFASDGFVRGHSFRGFRVKSFSEIKEQYGDFVIVLSFASNRREVIEMLAKIDAEHEMYAPDMPIADTHEYFTKDFYNENYESILSAYNSLSDGESKKIFASVINYRLSGKISHLLSAFNTREEMYSLYPKDKIRVMIDGGAYNGDTAREAVDFLPNLEKIYAVEPDKRTFKKLSRFSEECSRVEVIPINAALYSSCSEGSIMSSANRNSSVLSTPSHQHKVEAVSLISVDSIARETVDYIKYDVEGAEYDALLGSQNTVESCSPVLLVSLYHKSRDIFALVNYLRGLYENYEFYIRRLYSLPAWELNLIMIPKDKA